EPGDVRAGRLDHPEVLVPLDQEVVALRGHAVLACCDLLVGPVETATEELDQHALAARDVVHRRLGELGQVDASCLARVHGYSLHRTGLLSWGSRPMEQSATRGRRYAAPRLTGCRPTPPASDAAAAHALC